MTVGIKSATLLESAQRTASEQSDKLRVAKFNWATVYSNVTTFTSGTLDVFIEVSNDGDNWARLRLPPDIVEDVQCEQQAAANVKAVTFPVAFRYVRVDAQMATTPDMVFDVKIDLRE